MAPLLVFARLRSDPMHAALRGKTIKTFRRLGTVIATASPDKPFRALFRAWMQQRNAEVRSCTNAYPCGRLTATKSLIER